MNLKIDKELKELLPPLTPDEYEQLEKSILKIGLLDKIKVWAGYIIDGHNRYSICKKNNIPITKKDIVELKLETKQQAIRWMLSYQLGRRNLSEYDRFEIVQKFKNYFTSKAKQNNSNGGKGLSTLTKVDTRKEMAKMVGVSTGTYQKLDRISKSDNEELKNKVKNKEVSINKAYKEITKAKKESKKIETTADVDSKIKQLEEEIALINRKKDKLYQKRNEVFESSSDEIECEVKYILEDGLFGCKYGRIYFYLIKGNNRTRIFSLSEMDYKKENIVAKLDREIELFFIKHHKNHDKEKNIIIAKFYETKDEILQKIKEIEEEEQQKQEQENKKFEDAFNQTFNQNSNPLSFSNEEKEWVEKILNAGYRTLANKHHPDNDGDAEKFKELTKTRDKLIEIFS